ncbi:hypothetical protein EDD36DRAFT_417024 [Exophiala viscosa]|uniref:Uncharacterized protein n=1 Tax=Exophiala viscosa TaxID=2486360 RepID=A0AAN6DZK8_9EURO|nr:hypothetical protein EDD36DRAFT_417024 [Exophiala viscosa]
MASSNSTTGLIGYGYRGELSRRTRRGQGHRVRCSHPGCGRYGHTSDRCWIAHPELRPENVRHAGEKAGRGHVLGDQTAKDVSPTPFRFLALPSEIQNRIFEEVYKQGHVLTIKKLMPPFGPTTLYHHMNLPKLHLASKKVYEDSSFAWETASNGHHLRVDFWLIHDIYPTPNNDHLRSKITKMTFFGYSLRDMHCTNFERIEWDNIETAFPNLEEIHVE